MKVYLKTICLPLILLLVCITASYSQPGKWIEGYYLNKNSDTIRGLIEFKEWGNNPASVNFKASSDNILLTPANTNMFAVNEGDTYIAYHGLRMTNPTNNVSKDDIDSSSKYEPVDVFLREVIRTDIAALYILEDKKRENYFIQRKGDTVKELLFKTYYENGQLAEDQIFLRQLQEVFGNEIVHKGLTNRLENTSYRESDLRDFVIAASNNQHNRKKKMNKYPAELCVIAGITSNTYKLVTFIDDMGNNPQFKASINPVVGLSYTLYRQRNFGRYFVNGQLKFYAYEIAGSGRLHDSKITSGLVVNLNIAPGLNVVQKPNMKWQIAAGLSTFYLSNNGEKVKYQAPSQEIVRSFKTPFIYAFSVNTSVLVHKRISVWATYVFPMTVTNYVHYTGTVTSVQGGVGYILSRRKK